MGVFLVSFFSMFVLAAVVLGFFFLWDTNTFAAALLWLILVGLSLGLLGSGIFLASVESYIAGGALVGVGSLGLVTMFAIAFD